MKNLICICLLLILVPIRADDGVGDDARAKQIEQMKKILSDPKATDKDLAHVAIMEMTLIDSDTKSIEERTKLLLSQKDVLDKAMPMLDRLVASEKARSDAQAAAPPPPPAGLSVGEVVMHKNDEEYGIVSFGWKVVLANGTDHDAKDVAVKVSFRDGDGVEISHDLMLGNAVKSGGYAEVTEESSMKTNDWYKVVHVVASCVEH